MQALKEEFQLLIHQLVFYTTQQLLLVTAFCWQTNHIFILKQAEKAQSNKLFFFLMNTEQQTYPYIKHSSISISYTKVTYHPKRQKMEYT